MKEYQGCIDRYKKLHDKVDLIDKTTCNGIKIGCLNNCKAGIKSKGFFGSGDSSSKPKLKKLDDGENKCRIFCNGQWVAWDCNDKNSSCPEEDVNAKKSGDKICSKCNKTFPVEYAYCPFEGAPLSFQESNPHITNFLGMVFAYIPPGVFMMDSPLSEKNRDGDEKLHKVTLTKGFYMQTTEVTQGEWKAVMGNNPSYFKNYGDDYPVEQVSWNDIQEFIHKLNQKAGGNTYRLPTEAEWEYACRAGTTTPFNTGNCLSSSQANYDGRYPYPGCSKGQYKKGTISVESFKPNTWGLYNMHGNVWEWCQDWYGNYPSGPVTNPTGANLGTYRVLRGGGWSNNARHTRSANRYYDSPDNGLSDTGFRLVQGQ